MFLDFAEALDTGDHDILPEKVKYYCIRGLPIN